MAAKKKPFVYAEAASELQTILDEIESGNADVDVLSEKVERAAELIRGCREALAGTELRVRKIVEELASESEPAPSGAEADDEV